MSQTPYSPPPPEPVPPVQTQGYIPQPKRSAWPTVIGIISTIFAAMGLICTPISLAINAFNPATQKVHEFMPEWYRTWELGSGLVGVAFAVLLLIAGISLMKRRPIGRSLHLIYAIIGTVMTVINAVAIVLLIGETSDMPDPMRYGMIGGGAGGVCLGLAYPIFLLIWFLRGPVAKEVKTWKAA